MTSDSCLKAMKYILVGFNFIVLAVGAIAIGLGAWALASDYGAKEMADLVGSNIYNGACIAIIVGGSIIAVISLMGCLGSCLENRVLLGIYFVIMLLILILFVAGAVVGFFFRDDLEEELEKQMKDTLVKEYSNYTGADKAVTSLWDTIQKKLECCGVSGDFKGDNSWFIWQKSTWFFTSAPGLDKDYVPTSCCNSKFVFDQCTKKNLDLTKPVQVSLATITSENPALYGDGCIDKLKDKIMEHIIAIAAISVVIIIVMVTCIIFSVCVCMEIRNKNMVV